MTTTEPLIVEFDKAGFPPVIEFVAAGDLLNGWHDPGVSWKLFEY
jgi:hypothetical protein